MFADSQALSVDGPQGLSCNLSVVIGGSGRWVQVVFSPFLVPEEDGKLFLVVYQHGNSIWAGPPASEVRPISASRCTAEWR